jgi:hypothetical protein
MESAFHEEARPVPGIRDPAPLVRATQRTAPALLGLFPLVALFAHQQKGRTTSQATCAAGGLLRRQTSHPTFSPMLWRWCVTLVRKELVGAGGF